MTLEEYESKHKKLAKAKKGYDSNRTLCVGVFLIVSYLTFKDKSYLTMPWYILLILGTILVASIGILIYDCFLIKKTSSQLKDLESNKPL